MYKCPSLEDNKTISMNTEAERDTFLEENFNDLNLK